MVGCRFLVSHSVFSRRFPACAGTFGFVNLKREENSGSERCKSWGNCEILSGLKKPLRGTLSIRDNISDLLFQLTLAFQKMCSPMFTEHSGPQWHHKVLLVFSVILSRPSVHTEWGAVFDKQQLVSTGVELRDEMRSELMCRPNNFRKRFKAWPNRFILSPCWDETLHSVISTALANRDKSRMGTW